MSNNCNMPKDKILLKMLSEYGKMTESHIEMLQKLEKFRLGLEKARDHHFQQWKISEGRFMALLSIWSCGGPIKATEIAQELNVTKATMTGLIDSLVASNLVEKFDCTEDRRVSFIQLTADGEKFLQSLLPEHVRCIKEFTETLSVQEAQQFNLLVDKLTANLPIFEPHE